MEGEKIYLKNFIQKHTLNTFRIGCEPTNYKILLSSPTTVKKIIKKFELTKMPANRRINQLKQAGLVKRKLRTGEIEPTRLAKRFIKVINTINSQVEEELPKYLK